VNTVRTRQGSALIEVMFAIVLLLIGILPVMNGITRSSVLGGRAGVRAETSELAFGQLENLRAVARTAAVLPPSLAVGGSLTVSQINYADTVTSNNGVRVERRWLVAAGPVVGSRDLQVRATVLEPARYAGMTIEYGTLIPR
jgi:Tfp pilus assembly protein PilV